MARSPWQSAMPHRTGCSWRGCDPRWHGRRSYGNAKGALGADPKLSLRIPANSGGGHAYVAAVSGKDASHAGPHLQFLDIFDGHSQATTSLSMIPTRITADGQTGIIYLLGDMGNVLQG